MKNMALALIFATGASAAAADGYSAPIVDPIVVAEDAAASSAPSAALVLALTTLIVFSAAISN